MSTSFATAQGKEGLDKDILTTNKISAKNG